MAAFHKTRNGEFGEWIQANENEEMGNVLIILTTNASVVTAFPSNTETVNTYALSTE